MLCALCCVLCAVCFVLYFCPSLTRRNSRVTYFELESLLLLNHYTCTYWNFWLCPFLVLLSMYSLSSDKMTWFFVLVHHYPNLSTLILLLSAWYWGSWLCLKAGMSSVLKQKCTWLSYSLPHPFLPTVYYWIDCLLLNWLSSRHYFSLSSLSFANSPHCLQSQFRLN